MILEIKGLFDEEGDINREISIRTEHKIQVLVTISMINPCGDGFLNF